MSSLNSASTLQEVLDSYAENASYEEDNSPAKAAAFVTACRLLLLLLPKRAVKGGRTSGEEVELDITVVQTQLQEARRWLSVNGLSADATRPVVYGFQHFRD